MLKAPCAWTHAAEPGTKLAETAVTGDATATFDRLWDLTRLYENKDHPVLQELRLSGRYNYQYHSAAGESGSKEGREHCRFLAGSKPRCSVIGW